MIYAALSRTAAFPRSIQKARIGALVARNARLREHRFCDGQRSFWTLTHYRVRRVRWPDHTAGTKARTMGSIDGNVP